MIRRSESVKNLVGKLLSIQKAMKPAKKTSDNPYFNSKYADLKEVVSAIADAMDSSGVYVQFRQFPQIESGVVVTTRIEDPESGEWEEFDSIGQPKDWGMQSVGSTETYLRRYALMAYFGIAPEDDDGNEATGKKPDKRQQKPQSEPTKPEPPKTPPKSQEPPKRMVGGRTEEYQAEKKLISFTQMDMIVGAVVAAGVTKEQWKDYIGYIYGYNSAVDIPIAMYDYMLAVIQQDPESIKNKKASDVVDFSKFRGDDVAR